MIGTILDPALEKCVGLEAIVGIADSEMQQRVVDALFELDSKVYLASSPQDALRKIQLHAFHIVVVQENYSLETMQLMACLPMVIRRNIFYTLIGDNLETANMMQSFVLSANLVVNSKDCGDFAAILMRCVMENNHFYRPFIYALQATAAD